MNTTVTAPSDVRFQFVAFSGRSPEPPEKRSLARVSHWLSLPFVVAVVIGAGVASSHAQVDGRATKDKERKAALVSTAVLERYEAREFQGVKYRLLKPIDLSENPNRKYPMILSLHGAAGTGDDNVRNLREWNTVMAQENLRRKHPCFVVVPQSTGPWRTPAMSAHYTDEKIARMSADWQEVVGGRRKPLQDPKGGNLDRVFLLLDALAKEFPIDLDRVYVLGHSMGGFGTWTAVAEQPDRFAAAITSAGWLGPWFDANAVKDVPIWSFQGAKDKTSQVSMGNSTFERMKAIGAKVKFTEMAKHGHNVNEAAFAYTGDTTANGGVTKYASDRCDKTPDVWDWLFGQKRAAK